MSKKKKTILFFLGFFILLGMALGASYALWTVNLTQNEENSLVASCFDITFEEDTNTNIKLEQTFPLTDDDGSKLKPYKFKIKNNCAAYVKYDVALEITKTTTLNSQYLKTKVNHESPKLLSGLEKGVVTLNTTKDAYLLDSWYLYENEVKEYELRVWLDEGVTKETEGVQGSIWGGIVTVTASYAENAPTPPGMLRNVGYYETNGMWEYKNSINKIVIQNEIKEIESSIKTTDESSAGDGSVMSYVVPNEDGTSYTAYLQSNRKLLLNPDSFSLFANFSKVTEIEGIEFLDTSNVTTMNDMFYRMSSLTSLDVSHFDTSNVTDMGNMFSGMSSLASLDLSHFDTSQVTTMAGMFYGMSSLSSLDLSYFDTSNVTNMGGMFNNMSSLTSLDVSHFDTSNVTNMSSMFSWMLQLTSLDLSHFDTSKVTSMGNMFYRAINLISLDVSSFDTSQVTAMDNMFCGLNSLASLDVSHFDTSNVTNMRAIFSGTSSLTSLNLISFDTSNVTDMSNMFNDMSSLTNLELGDHFDTSNVTTMDSMFHGLTNLQVLNLGEKFNTNKVTAMPSMFKNCSSLERLDLSGFDTSNVTTMWAMFSGMTNLKELNVTNFNTSKVEYMVNMFFNCRSLENLDLSSFDTSNVTNMYYMFSDSAKLNHITYGNNFVHKVDANIEGMYVNCPANKPTHESWDSITW